MSTTKPTWNTRCESQTFFTPPRRTSGLEWEESLTTIDQNQVVAHVDAPQDPEIARLGAALNDTYIPFGADGASGAARQVAQDGNAQNSQPGSMVWRSMAKSSGNYSNDAWDLADRFRAGNVDLAKLAHSELPEAMRGLTPEQRHAYVVGKLAERAQIQARIQELGNERATFVANAQRDAVGEESLDSAMLRTVTTRARAVGIALD
ncbi:MAG: hypothetical protein ACKV2T_10895 [Kofleriaceae bacterium]